MLIAAVAATVVLLANIAYLAQEVSHHVGGPLSRLLFQCVAERVSTVVLRARHTVRPILSYLPWLLLCCLVCCGVSSRGALPLL